MAAAGLPIENKTHAIDMVNAAIEILKTIENNPFGATIESVVIIGPNTPSWKRGIRSTRDARGPRDTYN